MLIPVRCFTCGNVLADKYDWYVDECKKLETKAAPESFFDKAHTGPILDKMGLDLYCCRRHLIAHVDMMSTI